MELSWTLPSLQEHFAHITQDIMDISGLKVILWIPVMLQFQLISNDSLNIDFKNK